MQSVHPSIIQSHQQQLNNPKLQDEAKIRIHAHATRGDSPIALPQVVIVVDKDDGESDGEHDLEDDEDDENIEVV